MEKKFKEIVHYIRRPVERRQFKDRRFFPRHEYLDHAPERRVNMIDRRTFGDRRMSPSEIKNTWKKAI